MVNVTKFKPPAIIVQHVEVNEVIRRISVDGVVDGHFTSVVFLEAEVPRKVKTDADWYSYLQKRLQEALPEVKDAA